MFYVESQTTAEFANSLFDNIVDPLVALMAFIAILFLIIFVIKYMWNTGSSAEDRRKGLFNIWKAILGLFIVVSIWTIFYFIGNLAGSDIDKLIDGPQGVSFKTYTIKPVKTPALKFNDIDTN